MPTGGINRTDLWKCSIAKQRLSSVRDIGGLCRKVPTISPATFLQRLEAKPALKDSLAVFFQGAHLKEVLDGSRGKSIVYLVGLHRRLVSNHDIADGRCITKTCHGLKAGPALKRQGRREGRGQARPYTCVNVRSETTLRGPAALPARRRPARQNRAAPIINGTTLVVSDLYSSTSGTCSRRPPRPPRSPTSV